MHENLPALVNAIAIRRSHRDFMPTPLKSEDRRKIEAFLKQISVPFEHSVEIRLVDTPPGERVFYYREPPLFAAFLSGPSIRDQATLGFLGEIFILFCESIGVNTCWMGHYNIKTGHRIVFGCDEKQAPRKMFCVTPLGYSPEKGGLLDRISEKKFSKKLKPLAAFLDPTSISPLPPDIEYALTLAGKAPSAMNTQNWSYGVKKTDHQIIIQLSKPKGYQHFKWRHYDVDVGTAAAHIWLGLVAKGITPVIDIEDATGDVIWTFRMNG